MWGTRRSEMGALIEVAVMFAAIELFIWRVRAYWPVAWVPMLVLVVVSNAVHGETLRQIGFGPHGFAGAARAGGPAVVAVFAGGIAAAFFAGTLRSIGFGAAAATMVIYAVWGIFQEYVLNGFFVNRLCDTSMPRAVVPFAAGLLFATAHFPNPLLVVVTVVGGWMASCFYLRHRNLLFLGLAHGLVGTLIYLAIPDQWSHHLYVGPGYVGFCQRYCGGAHLWLWPH